MKGRESVKNVSAIRKPVFISDAEEGYVNNAEQQVGAFNRTNTEEDENSPVPDKNKVYRDFPITENKFFKQIVRLSKDIFEQEEEFLKSPKSGDFLKTLIEDDRVTQRQFASQLDVAPQRLNEVVKGRRDMAPDFAVHLSEKLGEQALALLLVQATRTFLEKRTKTKDYKAY